MDNMRTYKIFLAFCSDFPDIDQVILAKENVNSIGRTAEFSLCKWSDRECNDGKSQNTILSENVEKCDILFRLVYKKYPGKKTGTWKEFKKARSLSIPCYTFVRTDTEESEKTYKKLCYVNGDNTGCILNYPQKDGTKEVGLQEMVEKELNAFREGRASERIDENNDSSSEGTSSSNDGSSNGPGKKHPFPWKVFLYLGAAIVLFAILFYPYYAKPKSEPAEPPYIEGPSIDSVRIAFEDSINAAETLIHQGKKKQALEELNRLRDTCAPEWPDLKARIDSLLSLFSLGTTPPQYVKKGCVVVSQNSEIVSYIRSKIKESPYGIVFPKKGKPEWTITISERSIDTIGEFDGETIYKSTVILTASITQNDEHKADQKSEDSSRSYESKEKALDNARNSALEKLASQIIDVIGQ